MSGTRINDEVRIQISAHTLDSYVLAAMNVEANLGRFQSSYEATNECGGWAVCKPSRVVASGSLIDATIHKLVAEMPEEMQAQLSDEAVLKANAAPGCVPWSVLDDDAAEGPIADDLLLTLSLVLYQVHGWKHRMACMKVSVRTPDGKTCRYLFPRPRVAATGGGGAALTWQRECECVQPHAFAHFQVQHRYDYHRWHVSWPWSGILQTPVDGTAVHVELKRG